MAVINLRAVFPKTAGVFSKEDTPLFYTLFGLQGIPVGGTLRRMIGMHGSTCSGSLGSYTRIYN